jgi:hypothetical protein
MSGVSNSSTAFLVTKSMSARLTTPKRSEEKTCKSLPHEENHDIGPLGRVVKKPNGKSLVTLLEKR